MFSPGGSSGSDSSYGQNGKTRKREMSNEKDWERARRGIYLLLNNKYDEAEELFRNRGDSIQLAAGYSYFVFIKAVMSFEEESLEEAMTVLQEVESRCSMNLGWFRAMKNKVMGSSQDVSQYELLEQQIILADAQVCHAFLHILTQESTSGFVKGGWALRKAWSLYHTAYDELLTQYNKIGLFNPNGTKNHWRLTESAPVTPASTPDCDQPFIPLLTNSDDNGTSLRRTIFRFFSPVSTPQICPDEVRRLMCAVSFGYGLFHLGISLLPSPVLRLIHVLGFVGDRDVGIQSLLFSRSGPDMRAPLAALALLWYYTVMSPLIAMDVDETGSGATKAETLIEESLPDFENSALFLFFRGRVHRLKNHVKEAVDVYIKAIENSGQKELSLLCLHEIAWCHLIRMDYRRSVMGFSQLRSSAKWSRPFYTYLSAVCYGCLNDVSHMTAMSQSLLRRTDRIKMNPVLLIIFRRAPLLTPTKYPFYYRLLAYEMLYLWNSLPPREGLAAIVEDCEKNENERYNSVGYLEPIVGLNSLIWGVALSHIGRDNEALEVLKSVVTRRANADLTRVDCHITAWSQYELAVLLIKNGQKRDGKEILEKVQTQYTNYDFENSLKLKIHTAIQQVSSP